MVETGGKKDHKRVERRSTGDCRSLDLDGDSREVRGWSHCHRSIRVSATMSIPPHHSEHPLQPVGNVLVMNIDNIAPQWNTYAVNFEALQSGPMVNSEC